MHRTETVTVTEKQKTSIVPKQVLRGFLSGFVMGMAGVFILTAIATSMTVTFRFDLFLMNIVLIGSALGLVGGVIGSIDG